MLTKQQITKIFDCYPVFKLVDTIAAEMFAHAKIVRFKAGSIVFEELQSCTAFPFVIEGNIRVVKRSETGREISL